MFVSSFISWSSSKASQKRTYATYPGIVGHCYKINESKRNSDKDKNVNKNNSTQLSTMLSIISECWPSLEFQWRHELRKSLEKVSFVEATLHSARAPMGRRYWIHTCSRPLGLDVGRNCDHFLIFFSASFYCLAASLCIWGSRLTSQTVQSFANTGHKLQQVAKVELC